MADHLRGIGKLKSILIPLIWLGIAMSIAEIVVGFSILEQPELNDATESLTLYDWVIFLSFILLIVTYCVFGRWIWVASKNLWDHMVLNYSPASNIWWHAVPFMNLYKPFDAMREIWSKSIRTDDSYIGVNEGYSVEIPIYMKIWWAGWIISNLAANISFRLPIGQTSVILDIVSAAAAIVSYYFVIRIITDITDAQEKGISSVREIFS